MKFHFKTTPTVSGIYLIINDISAKFYIGQASNLKDRWNRHIRLLKNGKHRNPVMLNDYKKRFGEVGNDDFLQFYILKEMPNSTVEERNLEEQKFIDMYYDNQNRCYNIKKLSDNSKHVNSLTPEITREKRIKQGLSAENLEHLRKVCEKNVGSKRSDETKSKMRNSRTAAHLEQVRQLGKSRKGIPLSDEAKQKIRKAKLGKPSKRKGIPRSEETIAKIKASILARKEKKLAQ